MVYDPDNSFARILRDELPSDRVYEDAEFVAFRNIAPAAPAHIVVIPRGEPPASPSGLSESDSQWVGRMVVVATRVAVEQGLVADGYRLVINNGANAGQSVEHLHLHILGGGRLGPIA
ncbi:MAG TPA: histidine triad nucleotide-binding protein [Dehalococcoidia bacterium]|nr:histidine triad nucleotide-binding protein [Dehalococcoidia bacterium]